MAEWKYNKWRNSYWKKEEAKLELFSSTDVYEDCDKNSKVIMRLEKGIQVIYREIILINNHLWIKFISTKKESFYIPIRTWNNVPPMKKEYKLGPLEHKIFDFPKRKRDKHMKKETRDGVDIYIDRDKEIMYISMNEKMTYESQKRLKESFGMLKGYQVMVFESINDIKFLN